MSSTSSTRRMAMAGLLVALATGCADSSMSSPERSATSRLTPGGWTSTADRGTRGPLVSTPSETTPIVPVSPMRNGGIRDVEDVLARVRPACAGCRAEGVGFDQRTGRLLVLRRGPAARVAGLSVVGAHGVLADLPCDEIACRDDGAQALGPGPHELTVWSPPAEVRVIGYDGTLRRTIDLSAVLGRSAEAGELAWSPDGTRLAVLTRALSSGQAPQVWVVDRDGGAPRRVHTATYDGPPEGAPLTYLWSLTWSPDGRRLGFVEEHARLHSGSEESLSIRAVSLLLPGHDGTGTPTTLYDYRSRPFDQAALLWSPDGSRAAVRIPDEVLELSAEDGSTLARHPSRCSMVSGPCIALIWPARRG